MLLKNICFPEEKGDVTFLVHIQCKHSYYTYKKARYFLHKFIEQRMISMLIYNEIF